MGPRVANRVPGRVRVQVRVRVRVVFAIASAVVKSVRNNCSNLRHNFGNTGLGFGWNTDNRVRSGVRVHVVLGSLWKNCGIVEMITVDTKCVRRGKSEIRLALCSRIFKM